MNEPTAELKIGGIPIKMSKKSKTPFMQTPHASSLVDKEILELLQSFSKELKKSEVRDNIMLREIKAIQDKLEEISRGQLNTLVEHMEKYAKMMVEAEDEQTAELSALALKETIGTMSQEEIRSLIADAFPKEDKTFQREVMEKLNKIYDGTVESHNIQVGGADRSRNTILNSINDLREKLNSIDAEVTSTRHMVRSLDSGGGLY